MNDMPVLLLTELLSSDDRLIANDVRQTHLSGHCPVAIRLPRESRIIRSCCGEGKTRCDVYYSPRAYFAVKVCEMARGRLLAQPEFAHALDIEWTPVAASFNTIRFVNGYPERFIGLMFEEMERLANSGTLEIRYGSFDALLSPDRAHALCHYHIVPSEMVPVSYTGGVSDLPDDMRGRLVEGMSWQDIRDAVVMLSPLQLAFMDGEPMNRHTPLDIELICACEHFDFAQVRNLVDRGANVHAANSYGDTALTAMTLALDDEYMDGRWRVDDYVQIADYLLSQGYNPNLAGYEACTALYATVYHPYLDIADFLLARGADPNAPSYLGDEWSTTGETVLAKVWLEKSIYPESDYGKLARLLLRHGALPVTPDDRLDEEGWLHEQSTENPEGQKPVPYQDALLHSVRSLDFFGLVRLVNAGCDREFRDGRGRNLLQIVLEEVSVGTAKAKFLQKLLEEMCLLLLCGLGLNLSSEELEKARRTCAERGYVEALQELDWVQAHGGIRNKP